jgi:hypothetical protein
MTSVLERILPDFHDSLLEVKREGKGIPLSEQVCLKLDGTPVPLETFATPFAYEGQSGAIVFFCGISLNESWRTICFWKVKPT